MTARGVLVTLALSWVLEDPPQWGAAMRAEFGSVEGRRARWEFAFGCLRTALVPGRRIGGYRRLAAGVVTCGVVVVCMALEVYGRIHYPTETAGGAGYSALFVMFLVVGAWLALRGCQRSSAEPTVARRYGTAGGVAAGVMYVVRGDTVARRQVRGAAGSGGSHRRGSHGEAGQRRLSQWGPSRVVGRADQRRGVLRRPDDLDLHGGGVVDP